ncbi:MAG TPA: type VI secretion system ATPase TssH, partial [Thermoanaerobaculia bacterium]|nr:type VI secretion system ATPase TssH [Thermoanaerobaculia bacterium]
HLLEGVTPDGEITEPARIAVTRELRSHFRPEFLNRVDDIVLFKPLRLAEIEKIVDLQTEDLRRRLIDRGVRLELTEAAREHVARQGYDPVYGARPLKRYLQHELESKIARALVAGEVTDGSMVKVDARGGVLAVEIENPVAKEAEVGVGV